MRPPSSSSSATSSSSTAPSSSAHRRTISSDRLLRLLAAALVLLATGSLLLSSLRLRCRHQSSSSSSSTTTTTNHYHGLRTIDAFSSEPCSPTLIDPRPLAYAPPHRFTELLQSSHPRFAPPSFVRKHRHLCAPEPRDREWSFCLPITARHDLPYCTAADRLDLLVPQTPQTLCYASVLHLLLVDVYTELLRHDARPALLFGSMLGAVRNASLIPFTEDADVGYVNAPTLRMRHVKQALWAKGYHLFRQGVLRVCVAPTHPLAGNLYDPRRDSLQRARHVPYVDLYKMQLALHRRAYDVEETRQHRPVPLDKFEPYATTTVNGMAFATLADPEEFLLHEYGPQWRTPLRRGAYRVVDGSGDKADDLPEAARPPRVFDGAYDLADGEYDSAVDYEYDMPEIGDVEAGAASSHDLLQRDDDEENDDNREEGGADEDVA